MAKAEIFKGLPTWAKGIIAIAIVGGIGIVGYTIYKKLKSVGDKGKDDTAKETEKLAAKDYNDLVKAGQKITFPPSAYAAANETIVKLLDGCESIFSEIKAIEEVIKVVKKPVDWYYLVKTFGQKDIDNCGYWQGETRYSLEGLLKEQLNQSKTYLFGATLGGWKCPAGVYQNSKDILSAYLKTVGITTF